MMLIGGLSAAGCDDFSTIVWTLLRALIKVDVAWRLARVCAVTMSLESSAGSP